MPCEQLASPIVACGKQTHRSTWLASMRVRAPWFQSQHDSECRCPPAAAASRSTAAINRVHSAPLAAPRPRLPLPPHHTGSPATTLKQLLVGVHARSTAGSGRDPHLCYAAAARRPELQHAMAACWCRGCAPHHLLWNGVIEPLPSSLRTCSGSASSGGQLTSRSLMTRPVPGADHAWGRAARGNRTVAGDHGRRQGQQLS